MSPDDVDTFVYKLSEFLTMLFEPYSNGERNYN